ncbi:MAG: tyramine oxidase, partial [Rubrobacteraceae bacterium]|nr:tyramine oxidase [Rubrobacteraceae bacterium]
MQTPHPLDPLTAAEIRHAVGILRRAKGVGARWRFASIELKEPTKGEFAGDGETLPRRAIVVLWNRDDGLAYRSVVSLSEDAVVTWEARPGEQPNITEDEFAEAGEALRRNPRVAEALAARGITDLGAVLFDTWAYGGSLVAEHHRGRRVGWVDVWYRDAPDSNPYANPVNGLHFVVDFNSMELLEVEDDFVVEKPRVMGEYLPHLVPGLRQRDDLEPLHVHQPEGPSFVLEGNELRWQKWVMRVGFNYREGLVLHRVGYEDRGRVRSVAHRLSFAEMVVPYRDPSPDHYRRTAFDIGEWGLGFMTTSLELGCDCLGEISYLDATLHDSKGEPRVIKNAVCIHEEDDAVLWKHV